MPKKRALSSGEVSSERMACQSEWKMSTEPTTGWREGFLRSWRGAEEEVEGLDGVETRPESRERYSIVRMGALGAKVRGRCHAEEASLMVSSDIEGGL